MRRKTKEEYIEVICLLEREQGRAQTGMIAEAIDVKPPSVTEVLRKLEEKGLIVYEPYVGATLTEAGFEMARDLWQRHRTFADLLRLLGVDRKVAEAEGRRLPVRASREPGDA